MDKDIPVLKNVYTTFMDMSKPMTQNNYDKIVKKFCDVTEIVAKDTMSDAIQEIREKSSIPQDKTMDMSISQDGSWQRRGYSSLNGCITAIAMDNGKVVDMEPMSKYCRGCNGMEETRLKDPMKYSEWKVHHVCNFNYKGSAGGMEQEGARRIFNRSIDKHNV